ncbi:hypothetical protein N7539_000248 [Penicillium diatomitis]|uniref:Uncharacterized protein n=1 Tax=Penicillium diatomitis TaxID=2819901 RepID=A0A9W9XLE9_9EURO|nr:uncharacterized protein N7539_000248 [Penicillium diatomitis]KAJ5495132.1 hypothetical protein N7539_000248 [Penicillium diatomitis]
MEESYIRYPMATVVPLLSILSITVCITPLILHAKNRNLPATSLICWTILLNVFNIINAFIWPTDDINSWWSGVGLCDIEVKLMVGSYVAFPGALVGIFRGLAVVLDTASTTLVPSQTQRWRKRIIELVFCVVIPSLAMITHIIWQKSRYLLFSISGCVNNFDESWVTFVLAYMWPPIICLIAAYYGCLVLIRMRKYRSDFSSILRSANSRMSKSGFLRLFFLASTMLVAILPTEIYVLYYDLTLSLPWHAYSWSAIHGPEWYVIQKFPTYGQVFFDRWTPIAAGYMLFIFFGFGRDATRIYHNFFWRIGLGHCFPMFAQPTDSTSSGSGSNSTTLVGSTISRAKLLFYWGKGTNSSGHDHSLSSQSDTGRKPEDRNRVHSRHRRGRGTSRRQWLPNFWSRSKNNARRDDETLLDLSQPSQTVCTSAWASTSQSRGSCELDAACSSGPNDGIKIKQVISQNSVVEV